MFVFVGSKVCKCSNFVYVQCECVDSNRNDLEVLVGCAKHCSCLVGRGGGVERKGGGD